MNTLDTLAKKADVLEVMRKRGDKNYDEAYKQYKKELDEYIEQETNKAMEFFKDNLE